MLRAIIVNPQPLCALLVVLHLEDSVAQVDPLADVIRQDPADEILDEPPSPKSGKQTPADVSRFDGYVPHGLALRPDLGRQDTVASEVGVEAFAVNCLRPRSGLFLRLEARTRLDPRGVRRTRPPRLSVKHHLDG